MFFFSTFHPSAFARPQGSPTNILAASSSPLSCHCSQAVATLANSNRFKEGDHAYALALINPKGGFYAEYAVVKADNVSPIPKKLSVEQAGVMPSDALTALRGLDEILKLKKGESLMVFGAGGGIGHLAVQLARRIGARVFAVASGDDGVALAKRLGADAVANGREDDVEAAVRAFAPNGLDAGPHYGRWRNHFT